MFKIPADNKNIRKLDDPVNKYSSVGLILVWLDLIEKFSPMTNILAIVANIVDTLHEFGIKFPF